MRRQFKPVKRGVERSEYEEKVRRRGGRGEETKRRAPRIWSDGARECQTGRGAAKECTSFNQGCRYKSRECEMDEMLVVRRRRRR